MTFAEASKATFLDFEATASEPNPPALLGVLAPDSAFAQYILDPDLHDARRAHPALAVAELPALLQEIATDLERRDAVWCSWSTFDLSVIQNNVSTLEVRNILNHRFSNALGVVPAWAATYDFRPVREQFERRNQLHRFFEVAGYRPSWRYEQASPAEWIRHVRQRVKAARGRYLQVSTSTKRDWHRLLDYNRHDCVGLRHLVLRATAEAEKRRAYMNTVYSVRDGRRTIRFRIGSRKRAIEALLTRLGAREWAHMTAWNPGLTRLSTQGNHQRQAALARTISDRGFPILPGTGEDPGGAWPPEDSAFVIGIPAAEARELARMFGQWAIATGGVGEKSKLLWCLDPGPDTNVVAQLPLALQETDRQVQFKRRARARRHQMS